MNEQVETMPRVGTAAEMIQAGATIQQVRTQYATAVTVQRPRELGEIVKRCIAEAELSGDSFFYRWETESRNKKTGAVKKVPIEGPSINLALSAVRNFGNCVVEQRPVQETPTGWVFTGAFVDLETGFTIERQFRIAKDFPVYGEMNKHRKDDIRFQIGQSKCIRNVVMNAMPSGLIAKMMDSAKGSVRRHIESRIQKAGGDIDKVIDQMLERFARFNVEQKMIETRLDLPRERWDVETLVMLSGDLKALQNGVETAESLFGEDEQETPRNGGPKGTDDLAEELKQRRGRNQQERPADPAPTQRRISDPLRDELRNGRLMLEQYMAQGLPEQARFECEVTIDAIPWDTLDKVSDAELKPLVADMRGAVQQAAEAIIEGKKESRQSSSKDGDDF